MAAQRPVYVFVGGVSHTPAFFSLLISELQKLEYEAVAVSYPTVGEPSDTEGTTQPDEVEAIQAAVANIVEGRKRDVVLVLHSYGGWPGSRAVKGWDRETRKSLGKESGIVEVVFLAAFLLPDNADMATYSHLPDWLTVENGVRFLNENCIPLLFSDLDSEAQQKWFAEFRPQRNDFTAKTVPDAPWHLSIPKTYILTMADQTATLQFQFAMLQGVIGESWSIKSIKAGHEPMISRPGELARVLVAETY